jgi:SF3a60/Prp9 C-terminal/Replication stress response SDE2 C-terminal
MASHLPPPTEPTMLPHPPPFNNYFHNTNSAPIIAATLTEEPLHPATEEMTHFSSSVRSRALALERARQDETELQAWTLFATSQLLHPSKNSSFVVETNERPVAAAWQALVAPSDERDVGTTDLPSTTTIPPASQLEEESQYRISVPAGGQYAVATRTLCLDRTLHRMADLAEDLRRQRADPMLRETPILPPMQHNNNAPDAEPWFQVLYTKLQELTQYHGEHPNAPPTFEEAGGSHLLAATLRQWTSTLDTLYTAEEVMGKYLDLKNVYDLFMRDCASILPTHVSDGAVKMNGNGKRPLTTNTSSSYSYIDFMRDLSKGGGLVHWLEVEKLQHRKKYLRWLMTLQEYLESFLRRTVPLLSIESLQQEATVAFSETWSRIGGAPPGWSVKQAEAHLASTLVLGIKIGADTSLVEQNTETSIAPISSSSSSSIDLSLYETAQDLASRVDGDVLKVELARLGLKCGGTVADRAARLFLIKHQSLDELPAKLFKIKPPPKKATEKPADSKDKDVNLHAPIPKLERRIDIAHREAVISALLGQLGPVLEATLRRAERRQTQTLVEHEREVEDELYKSSGVVAPKDQNEGDGSDDEDAPIYNPKNVPLDFDGKPIPYWLFKLHGLNHYYPCEICGGESYRGRRNFELHFGETRHAAGMRSLGIPNTKHFHGVTKIEDAQELWSILQKKLGTDSQQQMYGGWNDEEYEDSQGNVLSRATYEDMARQNLL